MRNPMIVSIAAFLRSLLYVCKKHPLILLVVTFFPALEPYTLIITRIPGIPVLSLKSVRPDSCRIVSLFCSGTRPLTG